FHSSCIFAVFILCHSALLLSTLFPYTTLFRSRVEVVERDEFDADPGCRLCGEVRIVSDHLHLQTLGPVGNHRADVADADDSERLDRKSTRLNSSHVSISYAVFCLKKKTPNRQT